MVSIMKLLIKFIKKNNKDIIFLFLALILGVIIKDPLSSVWSKITGNTPDIEMYLSYNDYIENDNGLKNLSYFIEKIYLPDENKEVDSIKVRDYYFILTDNPILHHDFIQKGTNRRKCHVYTSDWWDNFNWFEWNFLKLKLLFGGSFSIKTMSTFDPSYPYNCTNCHQFNINVVNNGKAVGKDFRARICFDNLKININSVQGDFKLYEGNCIYAEKDNFAQTDTLKGTIIVEYLEIKYLPEEIETVTAMWVNGEPISSKKIWKITNILISNCTTKYYENPHYIFR